MVAKLYFWGNSTENKAGAALPAGLEIWGGAFSSQKSLTKHCLQASIPDYLLCKGVCGCHPLHLLLLLNSPGGVLLLVGPFPWVSLCCYLS